MSMTLMETIEAVAERECDGESFDDVIIETSPDHRIVGSGPMIEVPSLGLSMIEMTCEMWNPEENDYIPDWAGTAFFIDNVYAYGEQDGMPVAYYNFFKMMYGGEADFNIEAVIKENAANEIEPILDTGYEEDEEDYEYTA